MHENLDIRALGAMCFVDATSGARVEVPLEVSVDGARLTQNRGGAYVVHARRGLEAHPEALLAPPNEPAVGAASLDVQVRDKSGRYLSRSFRYVLPRDPSPAHASQQHSLFHSPSIPLYPSPAAKTFPGWTIVRARVVRASDGAGLPSVYFRLRKAGAALDAPPLASALGDLRGEAMVAVAQIPVVSWPEDPDSPVLSFEQSAVLDAYFDRDATSPPDPDRMEQKRSLPPDDPGALRSASLNLTLTSGHVTSVRLTID